MNLYLISRDGMADYDEYQSAVVIAEDEEQARNIHPNGTIRYIDPDDSDDMWGLARRSIRDKVRGWVMPNEVTVERIGPYEGKDLRFVVICADFRNG